MTQKTLTIRGKKFSGNQIASKMIAENKCNEVDYFINLNGETFWATFRDYRIGEYLAPICSRNNASALALMPNDGTFNYSIWIMLD